MRQAVTWTRSNMRINRYMHANYHTAIHIYIYIYVCTYIHMHTESTGSWRSVQTPDAVSNLTERQDGHVLRCGLQRVHCLPERRASRLHPLSGRAAGDALNAWGVLCRFLRTNAWHVYGCPKAPKGFPFSLVAFWTQTSLVAFSIGSQMPAAQVPNEREGFLLLSTAYG